MSDRPRTRAAIWRRAGRRAEEAGSADAVVRRTGWVFNNVTGKAASLEAFVAQGAEEVERWFDGLGLSSPDDGAATVVEIGSGIGRMTAALTLRYGRVVACDIDPEFLVTCTETVARHGDPARLETAAVVDEGRRLPLPDASAHVVFSYITLQHCPPDVALALVREALRVVRPAGTVALNFRTWSPADVVLWPGGVLARLVWRLAPHLAERSRLITRLGWQANRVSPEQVVATVRGAASGEVQVVRSGARRRPLRVPPGVGQRRLDGLNPAHWWLVVTQISPGVRLPPLREGS